MTSLARSLEPHAAPAQIKMSTDGTYVLSSLDNALWLENRRTRRHIALELIPGSQIAITSSRAWTVRDGVLSSQLINAQRTAMAIDLGEGAVLSAARTSIVAGGPHGVWLVRDSGDAIQL